MDFIEIMIFCGYDLQKAHEIVKKQHGKNIIKEALDALEKVEPEPARAECR